MPLIIALVVICLIGLLWPNKTVSATLEHGPKDAEGCASTALWLIAAGLIMFVLVALVGGRVH